MMIEQDEQLQETEEGMILSDSSRRDAFCISLLAKRKEAIQGRAGSGIETDWTEDEEHYQGIDAANRAFASTGTMAQAKNWATGYGSIDAKQQSRSVIFLNITRPYVDAASARVADMLLPTDDRSWEIKPTPIPRIPAALMEQMGGVAAAKEAIEQSIIKAQEAGELMQSEIEDCLEESNWHGEVRQVIEDSARIGSGVLKGPFPVKRSARMYKDGALIEISEIKPGSKYIDPWNLYPDPSCGQSIHNGSYVFEREFISSRQLREMLEMPGYDREAIMRALKEGPSKTSDTPNNASKGKSDEQFEMWIFYGTCDADDLEAVGVQTEDETPKASAMAVLINDRIVKCALNVLDTGEFPYDVLAWQRRPGMPWGMGIGRQIRTAQRMLNGACRAMMDNSAVSSAPQTIIGNGVTPADGNYTISGPKLWRVEADAGVSDVRAAFNTFVVPSVQAELQNIINFALKIAEDTTGLPAMLQGIRGDAPETLGGMQMQNNNASGVLRRLAKRFDDYMTSPHIRRYYDWMMQHSERDDIKGDFQVDVRASSALVERDAQQHFLMSLLQASANPVYGLDPSKLAAELLKGQRYEPKRVQYDPERLQQIQAAQQPAQQPTDPTLGAKAKLIEAQILKVNAETTSKNVEAMFSATSAANQIALNPTIAPMTDKILGTAGLIDHDAAPFVPEPSGMEQGIDDLPENTSPNFPPNPDRGMDNGIETGMQ